MKIHLYVEHDLMIRHFVLSRAMEELTRQGHDVTLILPNNADSRVRHQVQADETIFPIHYIPVNQRRTFLWGRRFLLDKYRFSTDQYARTIKRTYSSTMGWKGNLLLNCLNLPIIRQFYVRHLDKSLKEVGKTELSEYLAAEKPDLVIHPSVLAGVYFDDLIDYCSDLNIPLLAIMNSWDNPCTKHGATGEPDCLLVWGQQTYMHAQKYMGMPESKIEMFGAAQFDVYRQPPLEDRVAFRQKHSLDPGCKILLYAGSSKGTAEIEHLDHLDKLIESGELAPMKVLYRPHPWGGGGKGGTAMLERKWKHISIESSMQEYLEKVRDGYNGMYLADYVQTHNVLSNIDYLVSPLSTIILEAALHNVPAMCFLPVEEEDASHFQVAKELPHFEEMFEMDIFPKAFSMGDFGIGIQKMVDISELPDKKERLAEACQVFLEPFEKSWAERLPDFCEKFVAKFNRNRR